MDDDDFMLYGEALSPKAFSPEIDVVSFEPDSKLIENQVEASKDFAHNSFQDISIHQEETLDDDAFDEPTDLVDESAILTSSLPFEAPKSKENEISAVDSTNLPLLNDSKLETISQNTPISKEDEKLTISLTKEEENSTLAPIPTSPQIRLTSNLENVIPNSNSPLTLVASATPSGTQTPVLMKETDSKINVCDSSLIKTNSNSDIPDLDISSDSESDESIDIIIEQPTTTETADLVRLNVLESRSKTDNPPAAGLSLGNGLDLDTPAFLDGVPLFDVVLDDLVDKPWRKPGADRTDYFNYGFDERTWLRYSQRQQYLRDTSNLLPHMGPNRAYAPDSGHANGTGNGLNTGMPSGTNRSGPVRFTLEAAFPRQQSINQSGATPNAESERDRDSLGAYPGGLANRHSRAPFHIYPTQNSTPSTLPPLSYSFNAPSISNRGMHGFTPSFLPPPIANARPAKNWRPRSPSPLVEDRDSRSRDNYTKRHSSRSPSRSRSRSPRTRHRTREPATESRDSRDSGRKGTPVISSSKESTRERRHRRDDQDGETDSLRSYDFKEPKESRSSKEVKESSRNRSRDPKDRDRSSHHESSRDIKEASKDTKSKDRDRGERRRDKEREKEKDKDRSGRISSHGNNGSSADSQIKIKTEKSESHRSSRDKEKERDREKDKDKDRERERKHSSDRQTEKSSETQQRRSIKDRLGSKIAAEESSSSSRKRSKTDKEESKKHRH